MPLQFQEKKKPTIGPGSYKGYTGHTRAYSGVFKRHYRSNKKNLTSKKNNNKLRIGVYKSHCRSSVIGLIKANSGVSKHYYRSSKNEKKKKALKKESSKKKMKKIRYLQQRFKHHHRSSTPKKKKKTIVAFSNATIGLANFFFCFKYKVSLTR